MNEFIPRYRLTASPLFKAKLVNGRIVFPHRNIIARLQECCATFGERLKERAS